MPDTHLPDPGNIDSWSGAGEVLGKLLPAMSPAQFVDEVCTAFNYTPLAKGSITIQPLEYADPLAHYKGTRLTKWGRFCGKYNAVSPALWRMLALAVAQAVLDEGDLSSFLADLRNGMAYLELPANWQRLMEDQE